MSKDIDPAFEMAGNIHVKNIIKDFGYKGEVLQGIMDAQRSEWQASWGRDNAERLNIKRGDRGFPGGPVVKTPCFHCGGAQDRSLVREVPHAARCGKKRKKKKMR